MISNIQNVLQKHYKWLLTILLGVIIVSFVFTYGASSGISTSGKNRKIEFYGFNLNSEEDQKTLFQGAELSIFLNTGTPLQTNGQLEQAALSRAILIRLAQDLHIPYPNEQQLVDYIRTIALFQNSQGQFDQELYNQFRRSVENNPKLSSDFVREVLSEDYRIKTVQKLLDSPGFVLPEEFAMQLERTSTQWALLVASITPDALKTKLDYSIEDLMVFFENNKTHYLDTPKVKFSYVLFEDTDIKRAEKKANDFLYFLYEQEVPYKSKSFNISLKEEGLSLTPLEPVDMHHAVAQGPIPQAALVGALQLSQVRYYSDPFRTENAFAVLFYEDEIAPKVPSFEEIHNQVEEDYKALRAHEAFDLAIKNIQAELSMEDVTPKQRLHKVAKEYGMELNTYKNITVNNVPENLGLTLVNAIQSLSVDSLSSPIRLDDRVYFVLVLDKTVDLSDISKEQEAVIDEQLNTLTALGRIQGSISELMEKGIKRLDRI